MAENDDFAGVCIHRDIWGWDCCLYYSDSLLSTKNVDG